MGDIRGAFHFYRKPGYSGAKSNEWRFLLEIIHYHTLSYIIIHYHTLSYIIKHYHTLSYIIIHHHTLSYIIIHYQRNTFTGVPYFSFLPKSSENHPYHLIRPASTMLHDEMRGFCQPCFAAGNCRSQSLTEKSKLCAKGTHSSVPFCLRKNHTVPYNRKFSPFLHTNGKRPCSYIRHLAESFSKIKINVVLHNPTLEECKCDNPPTSSGRE